MARTKVAPLDFIPKGVRVNSKSPSSHTKAVSHRWLGWTGVW